MSTQLFFEEAEDQIREKQKTVDYDTKEFTVELLVNKYVIGKNVDENEIFIPDYQRNFVWSPDRQSKFIESVILGLPIPYIFTADMNDGRLEIVDGTQRIRTLEAFMSNKLRLHGLEILNKLDGYYFQDLSIPRQRKFKNTTIRMVVISDKSDEDVRFLMFERINTGSDNLKNMEIRKALYPGNFTNFVYKCAEHPLFVKLTKFTPIAKSRGAAEELILRFFAYSEKYNEYKGYLSEFLNEYVKEKNRDFNENEERALLKKFETMLKFINKYFPSSFTKGGEINRTPQARFEAISVGTYLALEKEPLLNPTSDKLGIFDTETFQEKVFTKNSVNSPSRVKSRIEYVRDKLLSTI